MYTFANMIYLKGTGETVGAGWLPPVPDLRDYTSEHKSIKAISRKLGIKNEQQSIPETVDLRDWCSPVENQLQLGSCTAHAAVGVVEYFEKRAFNKYIEGSRLFVYKTTRNLMKVTGDTGSWLRNTMGALCLCGVPNEEYWPYTDNKDEFDREPSAFVYSIADNFEGLEYFAHDPQGSTTQPQALLTSIKQYLAAGIPSMFGFWGFSSFDYCDEPGGIPYPCPGEKAQWGHAIVAVGYDDKKKITNTRCNTTTTGALLIRNSWGITWGDQGYGWLPYDYITNKLAMDFWSLLNMEWINTNEFGFI